MNFAARTRLPSIPLHYRFMSPEEIAFAKQTLDAKTCTACSVPIFARLPNPAGQVEGQDQGPRPATTGQILFGGAMLLLVGGMMYVLTSKNVNVRMNPSRRQRSRRRRTVH